MFYAASEIVFWILLAAIVGGGIGYGLSQAKSVRLDKRLSQSRADAPMERELAIAWDTIEDLNRRLQVAHETIRDSAGESPAPAEAAEDTAAGDEEQEQPPAAEEASVEDDSSDNATIEIASTTNTAKTTRGKTTRAKTTRAQAAKGKPKPAAKQPNNGTVATDDTVGTRLSERVASASIANQVDFTDGGA